MSEATRPFTGIISYTRILANNYSGKPELVLSILIHEDAPAEKIKLPLDPSDDRVALTGRVLDALGYTGPVSGLRDPNALRGKAMKVCWETYKGRDGEMRRILSPYIEVGDDVLDLVDQRLGRVTDTAASTATADPFEEAEPALEASETRVDVASGESSDPLAD